MTYLLRHIPAALWTRCRQKAKNQHRSMRAVLIALLSAWANEP